MIETSEEVPTKSPLLAIPCTTRTEFIFVPPNRTDSYVTAVATRIQCEAIAWSWCVYAHIKPQHPLFGCAPMLRLLPLHRGCTLLHTKTTRNRGEYTDAKRNNHTVWVVGADYQHGGDMFMTYNPADGVPHAILRDVALLLKALITESEGGAA